MDTNVHVELEPLSPILGARVRGIDLRRECSEAEVIELRKSFARYHVLCFPDQEITNDDQIRFARIFGRADADFIGKPQNVDYPADDGPAKRGVMFISNIREEGKQVGALPDGELHFHSDGAHRKSPYRATTLYGIKIPSRGGETKFANLELAYQRLPQELKQRIETLKVRNVYDTRATLRSQTNEDDDTLSNAVHPLVRVHPDTGYKSLFCSRLMTRNIVGMDLAESGALLAQLFEHIEKPEFVYAHKWTPGDLLIWDNRCLNHARNDFPAEETRHLRRVTISEPAE